MPTDNYDLGRDAVGGTKPSTERAEGSPGYETTDVNVGGVIVFLTGLSIFVLIFFVFCFVMGKVINNAFLKEDGPIDKWHAKERQLASTNTGAKREDLASNPAMEQRQLQEMTSIFPTPRLQMDDGNQDLADLHAREDLLLENYSSENGTTRIPIERAMELIAQRGLPVMPAAQAGGQQMVGDVRLQVLAPLTNGFARTGYELDAMEAREQRLNYEREAPTNTHAELKPIR
jgi:hypothetical protein